MCQRAVGEKVRGPTAFCFGAPRSLLTYVQVFFYLPTLMPSVLFPLPTAVGSMEEMKHIFYLFTDTSFSVLFLPLNY